MDEFKFILNYLIIFLLAVQIQKIMNKNKLADSNL